MIRPGAPGDREGLEALYDNCFPGEEGFRRWFFESVWEPENTLLWEEEGVIPSAMQLLPGNLVLDGTPLPAGYVWAAGTHPNYRGRGLMARLLEYSFAVGLERGHVFSTLITQNDSLFAFYRPFGYDTIAKVARVPVAPSPLPEGYQVRPAAVADAQVVLDLYRRATSGMAAMERDRTHFDRMLALYGERHVVMEDKMGDVKAYAFLEKQGASMSVIEAVGEETLAAHLAEVWRCSVYQRPVIRGDGVTAPIGCVKALTREAELLLETQMLPPYLNLLFN